MKIFAVMILAVLASSANADWADPRAVYLCDKQNGVFVAKSVMFTSAPDEGTVDVPSGYVFFETNKKFKCKVGKAIVEANISVVQPHPGGNCAAYTWTYINSMRVNARKVFPHMQIFNSPCADSDESVLYEIKVQSRKNETHFEACYATWAWGVGYTKKYCDELRF